MPRRDDPRHDATRRPVKPPKPDPKVDKWIRWIEGPIRSEVLSIHHHRDVYRSVGKIVNEREPKLPGSLFFDYLGATYATTQAVAIRRVAERSPRVVSLGELLHEISESPELMTRRRFVSGYDPLDQVTGPRSLVHLL